MGSLIALFYRVTWSFWLKRIVPVGACTASTLAFGNAVYLHLSVAFIQMLKSFTPCIVLVVVVIAGMEKPTQKYAKPAVCFPTVLL